MKKKSVQKQINRLEKQLKRFKYQGDFCEGSEPDNDSMYGVLHHGGEIPNMNLSQKSRLIKKINTLKTK